MSDASSAKRNLSSWMSSDEKGSKARRKKQDDNNDDDNSQFPRLLVIIIQGAKPRGDYLNLIANWGLLMYLVWTGWRRVCVVGVC